MDLSTLKVTDICGLFGVIIVLGTYLFMQIEKLRPTGLYFSLFNFVGSMFLLISLAGDWNLSSALVEVIWQLISVYGMFSYFKNRRNNSKLVSEENLSY